MTSAEEAREHLLGIRGFYVMRKHWSRFLMACIGFLLLFHVAITILVGIHLLEFTNYKWFLPLVITENFGQIIGLAFLVVKFLFSEPGRRPR